MNLHEYQSKELFFPDEAAAGAKALGGSLWVFKAPMHAGGRGKAGGVKVVELK
jgi:succinyl-CoA synthetase beta subunit